MMAQLAVNYSMGLLNEVEDWGIGLLWYAVGYLHRHSRNFSRNRASSPEVFTSTRCNRFYMLKHTTKMEEIFTVPLTRF